MAATVFYFTGVCSDAGGGETFARQREKSTSSDRDRILVSIVTDQQLSAAPQHWYLTSIIFRFRCI